MIEIAKERQKENITFAVANMFDLITGEKFDVVFGGFIWSHILLQDLDKFLDKIKSFLNPNGTIVFIDGKAVTGTNHDLKNITKTDENGNTFQTRKLEDGTTHLVLKNFPTNGFLQQKLSRIASDFDFIETEFYWIVSCKIVEELSEQN